MMSYTLELCIFAMDEVPDTEIYFDWPTHCQGWRLKPWTEFERQFAARDRYWGKTRVDGCRYNLADPATGLLLKKPWSV